MRVPRTLVATCSAAILVLGASAAMADDFANNLDLTVDTALETITVPVTSTAPVQIRLIKDKNCDLAGNDANRKKVVLSASSSDPGVASVAFTGGISTITECGQFVTVDVTGLAVGTSTVTFTGEETAPPPSTFTYGGAAFIVNVTDGAPPAACDADPAAPAWAAAILKASGVKNGNTATNNYVAIIAKEMTQGAVFAGFDKADHPSYENAVHDRLEVLTRKTLRSAADSARPGWECAPIAVTLPTP